MNSSVSIQTIHSVGKKNYSGGKYITSLWRGRKERERKQKKYGFVGRKAASSPDAERSERKWGTQAPWELGAPAGKSSRELGWDPFLVASSNLGSQQAFQTAGGGQATCTKHTVSCKQTSLYLLGSWGTGHWQKGTLWLSPRFSFFLCFLSAAGPREKRVHWVALRSYLYCPHTRSVHLSDPSALKNCQLFKEEGINMFKKMSGEERWEKGEREKDGQALGNTPPHGSWSDGVGKHQKYTTHLRKRRGGGKMNEVSIQVSSTCILSLLIFNQWLHLTRVITFWNVYFTILVQTTPPTPPCHEANTVLWTTWPPTV